MPQISFLVCLLYTFNSLIKAQCAEEEHGVPLSESGRSLLPEAFLGSPPVRSAGAPLLGEVPLLGEAPLLENLRQIGKQLLLGHVRVSQFNPKQTIGNHL